MNELQSIIDQLKGLTNPRCHDTVQEKGEELVKETAKLLAALIKDDTDCPDCPFEDACFYETDGCILGVHVE